MQSIPSTIYNKAENISVLSSAIKENDFFLLLREFKGEGSGSQKLISLIGLSSVSLLMFFFEVWEN